MSEHLQSAGPWTFSPDNDLSVGESYVLNFENMKLNGSKGGYRQHLPFDNLQITNQDGSNVIEISINGRHSAEVVPNAVESYSDAGVRRVVVTNVGSSAISAGDLTVEVSSDAYDADQAARDRAAQSPLEAAVNSFLPGGR